MKKSFYFSLFLLLPVWLYAQTPGTTSGTTSGGGINIGPKPKPPTRPKAPSNQIVEASYEDGYVYLNFKYSEGSAVLYVFESDQSTLRSQHMFSTDSEAAIYIGNVTDAYLLVETSNGHLLRGSSKRLIANSALHTGLLCDHPLRGFTHLGFSAYSAPLPISA